MGVSLGWLTDHGLLLCARTIPCAHTQAFFHGGLYSNDATTPVNGSYLEVMDLRTMSPYLIQVRVVLWCCGVVVLWCGGVVVGWDSSRTGGSLQQ